MLLKWSKNADGYPRAKARLVVRGYADVDALAGSLETASPASTRLGKTLFLSLSSCLGLGELADLRLSCMFDAAHGVRHDGSSQGGFLCLLTHKWKPLRALKRHTMFWSGNPSSYPVLPAHLAAEAQAAGAAADSVEFIVRFWNELMKPGLDLKANLAMDTSSLQPVLITDAKALRDTYHRDAFNHGSNDKRAALEV